MECDVYVIPLGNAMGLLGPGDGSQNRVSQVPGCVCSRLQRYLDKAVALCQGNALYGRIHSIDCADIDRGIGEVFFVGAVQHLAVVRVTDNGIYFFC